MKINGRLFRFGRLALPYWLKDNKWEAWGLLLLLIALMFANTEFSVWLNEQSGEATSALAAGNSARFWRAIRKSAALLSISVPVFACYYYVRDRLGNQWRKWMTGNFLNRWLSQRAYYRLASDATIDNPDQRISEDINTFTQRSLYFLLLFAGAVIQLIAFSGVLWSISRLLVLCLAVYAVVGTLIAAGVFGKKLTGLNFLQLKREADFRFQLIRIRENAESIAFYRGEESEKTQARRAFLSAFVNYNKLIRWQFFLNFYQYGFTSVTTLIPSIILARQVLEGELEVGRVVQAIGAFTAVLSAFTVIVENFESLSRFVAGVDRLFSFRKALEALGSQSKGDDQIESEEASRLALEHVTVETPGHQRTLVKDLSLAIDPGKGLLIVGPSGSGKSSLLRAIAGLWTAGKGKILRPKPEEMMFLPQKPYMIVGTLRDQLLYPGTNRDTSDEELHQVLEVVNLPHLIERAGGLDAELDWGKVLSLGEQQRVAIARVLLADPRYVMLDEATSALDVANEDRLYRTLRKNSMTLVSVCHRPSILKFHQQVLELDEGEGVKVVESNEYEFSQEP